MTEELCDRPFSGSVSLNQQVRSGRCSHTKTSLWRCTCWVAAFSCTMLQSGCLDAAAVSLRMMLFSVMFINTQGDIQRNYDGLKGISVDAHLVWDRHLFSSFRLEIRVLGFGDGCFVLLGRSLLAFACAPKAGA